MRIALIGATTAKAKEKNESLHVNPSHEGSV
jgi:hypothetical protein